LRSLWRGLAGCLLLLLGCAQLQGQTLSNSQTLSYSVVDAEYSRETDRMVLVSSNPAAIRVFDRGLAPESLQLPLVADPKSVSVSPNGRYAAVGHTNLISYFDLSLGVQLASFAFPVEAADVVVAGNGFIYAFSNSGNGPAYWVSIATGQVTTGQYPYTPTGDMTARLHPSGERLYISYGNSNEVLSSVPIVDGAITTNGSYAVGRYVCGNHWMSDDGLRVFTRCGSVFRASANGAHELRYEFKMTEPSMIRHLTHSPALNAVLLIPDQYFSEPPADTELRLYEYQFLGLAKRVPLPAGEHGRFVFTTNDGSHALVVTQSDSGSFSILDYTSLESLTPPDFRLTETSGSLLGYSVTDAAYSKALDKIVTVSEGPNRLHIYDPETRRETATMSLSKPARNLTVSVDGATAVVNYGKSIDYVNLVTAFDLQMEAATVLVADGFFYIVPKAPGIAQKVRSLNLQTGEERVAGEYLVFSSLTRLDPSGRYLHHLSSATSSPLHKFRVAGGDAGHLYSSPFYQSFSCGDFWYAETGTFLVTACGSIATSTETQSSDMVITATLPGVRLLQSAFHSASSGRIATLTTDVPLGDGGRDNVGALLKTFDDRTFETTGKRTLPGFIVGGRQFFPGSGQFVFMNNSGRRTYVVMRTGPDPRAGFDYRLSGVVHDSAVVAMDTEFTPELPLSVSGQGSLFVRGMLQSSSTSTGSAVLRTLSGGLAASATMNYRQGGVMVSEATVPVSSPILSGRFYAEVATPVNTGVAFANPSDDQTAVIRFYYTTAAGRSAEGSFSLPPRGQIAKFLDEFPFNSMGVLAGVGSLTFTSNVPVGAIALRTYINDRSEFLFTTMTVTDLAAPPVGGTVVFPHFALGAGWRSQIVLVNPTEQPVAGSFAIWGQGTARRAAEPLTVSLNGQVGSTFPFDLPAGAAQLYELGTMTSGLVVGSIRMTSTGTTVPTGSVIFYYAPGSVTLSTASVPATRPANAVRLLAQGTYQFYSLLPLSTSTGLAIANLSATPADVTLEYTAPDGRSWGTSVVRVPGNGQIAAFAGDLGFSPIGYYLLRVTTDSPAGVAVLGILGRYNERQEFLLSTTPVYREDEPPGSLQVLPHFAQGGGFTTELLLFNRNDSTAATSILTSFAPDGSVVDLDLR
jgi:hypothetical protein